MRFRIIALQLVAIWTALMPCAAAAYSTEREIADSRTVDEQVVAGLGVVKDPLLNAYVTRIARRVWTGVHREGVPFTIKIIDTDEINAFSIGGGYIYMQMGMLDLLGCDDELAAVIGHETGHDARRHTITYRQRGEVLSVLFGLASLFSAALAALGHVAQAGMMARTSRNDEYQADSEGLRYVMSAGFDPTGMTSMLRRLQAIEGGDAGSGNKYLASHPATDQRIIKLEKTTEFTALRNDFSAGLASAGDAAASTRYAVAAARFRRLAEREPRNAAVALQLGRMEILTASPARAREHLQFAAKSADPQIHEAAAVGLLDLTHEAVTRGSYAAPDLARLRASIVATRAQMQTSAVATTAVRERARSTLASIRSRIAQMSVGAYEINDETTDTHDITRRLMELGRSISVTVERATTIVSGIGTLDRNKESGLWAASAALSQQMASTVSLAEIPPESRAMLRFYPEMNSQLQAADADLASAANGAYRSLMHLYAGLAAFDALSVSIREEQRRSPSPKALGEFIRPKIEAAQNALQGPLDEAIAAAHRYNAARARQLQMNLTLLNLDSYTDRRAGLERSILHHIAHRGDVSDAVRAQTSAGEYSAARIIAADTGGSAAGLLAHARQKHVSVLDLPEAAKVDPQVTEIFLGFTYVDYTDDSAKDDPGAKGKAT